MPDRRYEFACPECGNTATEAQLIRRAQGTEGTVAVMPRVVCENFAAHPGRVPDMKYRPAALNV